MEAQFCPRDKPSLSLGQSRGPRAAEKVCVLKVYVAASPAKSEQVGTNWGIPQNKELELERSKENSEIGTKDKRLSGWPPVW